MCRNTDYWIGGHAENGKFGNWTWLDGSPAINLPWEPTQPNINNESCIRIVDFKWFDQACWRPKYYICETIGNVLEIFLDKPYTFAQFYFKIAVMVYKATF